MKMVEVKKLSTNELAQRSVKLQEEIAALRQSLQMGELKNVRSIRAKRKDLARILTAMQSNLAKEGI